MMYFRMTYIKFFVEVLDRQSIAYCRRIYTGG